MTGPVHGPGQPAGLPHEHEFEASHGLPEALPGNERLLWQGGPSAWAMARDAFHLHHVAGYFAVLLVWRVASGFADGASAAVVLQGLIIPLPLMLAGLGLLYTLGWLTARTTAYTFTNRRVVMRIGIVLSVTFNLPFRQIDNAALRLRSDGSGDITLTLGGSDRIAWLHLWPHARPWQLKRPQPMLRGLADAAVPAKLLSEALAASAGMAPQAVIAPATPGDARGSQQHGMQPTTA